MLRVFRFCMLLPPSAALFSFRAMAAHTAWASVREQGRGHFLAQLQHLVFPFADFRREKKCRSSRAFIVIMNLVLPPCNVK